MLHKYHCYQKSGISEKGKCDDLPGSTLYYPRKPGNRKNQGILAAVNI
jgi:hypothetical protein